jgi:hypothetical protein
MHIALLMSPSLIDSILFGKTVDFGKLNSRNNKYLPALPSPAFFHMLLAISGTPSGGLSISW